MQTRFFLVVEPSIKGFFLPLKGAFEVLTPEEFPGRLSRAKEKGLRRLIVHALPKDLLAILRRWASRFPEVEFIWANEDVPKVTAETLTLLSEANEPQKIEETSFEIISSIVDLASYPPELRPIILRLIHATGDLTFPQTLLIHPQAVETGIELIHSGYDILTDVEMLRSAINERRLTRWGGRVLCGLSEISEPPSGKTRTEAAIEKVLSENPKVGIVAIGNAPTALLATIRHLRENPRKILVIGLPVGFVKAAEAKLLLSLQPYPYFTNLGPRGGSAAAAAVINALLRLSDGQTSA